MSGVELCVNAERLRSDINELAQIGRHADQGLFRMAFSKGDLQGREWFRQRVADAGLEFYQDGAANLCARLEWNDRIPSVMAGSHLDTVPGAGHLDGALGVVCALEALRVLRESGIELKRPLEAVSFSDEEGRFGGLFGSQSIAGQVNAEYLLNANDLDGVNLVTAMAAVGFDAREAIRSQRQPGSIHAYVELHIEQGPVLDRRGLGLGIVDSITGLIKWEVSLYGKVNHAGTTPMNMRADAFQGLVEFAAQIDPVLAAKGGAHSTATIGRVELQPGAANVIPGKAVFSLDLRDSDLEILENLERVFRDRLSQIAQIRGLELELSVLSQIAPVRCASEVLAAIEQSAAAAALDSMHLRSGAAHDAQIIARVAPIGMIFVPSIGGRSHSVSESTQWEHIEAGANILLNTLRRLAT